ncbi:exosortase/archaeosortase family protein [Pirellulales bacterium]|nr:exosortase/archaeosortase family protein [Pirellulales bacterium]
MSTSRLGYDELIDDEPQLDADAAQTTWFLYGAMVVLVTWVYWEVLRFTASYWDQGLYSHGWIVPVLAMWLAVSRARTEPNVDSRVIGGAVGVLFAAYLAARFAMRPSEELAEAAVGLPGWFPALAVTVILGVFFYSMRGVRMYEVVPRDRWIGVGIVAVSLIGWVFFSRIDMNPIMRLSYVGSLLGVTLLIGGMAMIRWAGPAIAFLVFMFPLPSALERGGLLVLQKLAAIVSTAALQLLGQTATRDGNRLVIDQLAKQLEVADACSGLRMLTIFGAMSVAVAMTIDRPWWDRLIILASAIPIALLTNIIRIVVTALLFLWLGQENELVDKLIHDWAGLAMMPIALGFLWLEYEVLTRLSIPVDPDAEFSQPSFGVTARRA